MGDEGAEVLEGERGNEDACRERADVVLVDLDDELKKILWYLDVFRVHHAAVAAHIRRRIEHDRPDERLLVENRHRPLFERVQRRGHHLCAVCDREEDIRTQ